MLGAIVGDVIGSVHEGAGTKTKDFPLFVSRSTFTDDSVLTVAVAEWILSGQDLVDLLHAYYHNYPGRGYGGMFYGWASDRLRQPYNCFVPEARWRRLTTAWSGRGMVRLKPHRSSGLTIS